jgi:hypothetical protein
MTPCTPLAPACPPSPRATTASDIQPMFTQKAVKKSPAACQARLSGLDPPPPPRGCGRLLLLVLLSSLVNPKHNTLLSQPLPPRGELSHNRNRFCIGRGHEAAGLKPPWLPWRDGCPEGRLDAVHTPWHLCCLPASRKKSPPAVLCRLTVLCWGGQHLMD